MIKKVDNLWQTHLLQIDHLRTDVNLRTVGQKDPLMEFKQEAFFLFDEFSKNLKMEIASDLFRFEMVSPQVNLQDTIKDLQMHTQRSFVPQPNQTNEKTTQPVKATPRVNENKIKRNDNCPCGSGKKYKKCCGS